MNNRGIYLALATALISGFSVFLNKFATKSFADAYAFTTLKNIGTALLIVTIFFFPKIYGELRTLSRKQWFFLSLVGLIGGSAPFLLFFKGLTMTSATNAAFIHKTLFVWVGILAFFFLREKLGRLQILAIALIFGGNILLGGLKSWQFGLGDLLVLAATLLWSIEYIFAKKLLKNLTPEIVAWGRMFLGALALMIFIAVTGRAEQMFNLNLTQVGWLGISSVLLFGYVSFWYRALKYESASVVTCFLVPASLITTLLNSLFITHRFSFEQLIVSVIFVVALILLYKFRKINQNAPATSTI